MELKSKYAVRIKDKFLFKIRQIGGVKEISKNNF